ncbi:hypothetical protein Tco_1196013, partial [Tanacetum coccineum]
AKDGNITDSSVRVGGGWVGKVRVVGDGDVDRVVVVVCGDERESEERECKREAMS